MKRQPLIRVRRVNKEEKGLTLLEYAAGAAFILTIAVGVFGILSGGMEGFFNNLSNWLTTAPMPGNSVNTPGSGS